MTVPAFGTPSLPQANRGWQQPIEKPTDGVINWEKFVVKDLAHVEHTFVWTGHGYIRENVLSVGSKVVVGGLSSDHGQRFNGAEGWIRAENNGRYTVFCNASEQFPHGMEIELEGSNLFQVGADGTMRSTSPKRFEDQMLITQAEMEATGTQPMPFVDPARNKKISDLLDGKKAPSMRRPDYLFDDRMERGVRLLNRPPPRQQQPEPLGSYVELSGAARQVGSAAAAGAASLATAAAGGLASMFGAAASAAVDAAARSLSPRNANAQAQQTLQQDDFQFTNQQSRPAFSRGDLGTLPMTPGISQEQEASYGVHQQQGGDMVLHQDYLAARTGSGLPSGSSRTPRGTPPDTGSGRMGSARNSARNVDNYQVNMEAPREMTFDQALEKWKAADTQQSLASAQPGSATELSGAFPPGSGLDMPQLQIGKIDKRHISVRRSSVDRAIVPLQPVPRPLEPAPATQLQAVQQPPGSSAAIPIDAPESKPTTEIHPPGSSIIAAGGVPSGLAAPAPSSVSSNTHVGKLQREGMVGGSEQHIQSGSDITRVGPLQQITLPRAHLAPPASAPALKVSRVKETGKAPDGSEFKGLSNFDLTQHFAHQKQQAQEAQARQQKAMDDARKMNEAVLARFAAAAPGAGVTPTTVPRTAPSFRPAPVGQTTAVVSSSRVIAKAARGVSQPPHQPPLSAMSVGGPPVTSAQQRSVSELRPSGSGDTRLAEQNQQQDLDRTRERGEQMGRNESDTTVLYHEPASGTVLSRPTGAITSQAQAAAGVPVISSTQVIRMPSSHTQVIRMPSANRRVIASNQGSRVGSPAGSSHTLVPPRGIRISSVPRVRGNFAQPPSGPQLRPMSTGRGTMVTTMPTMRQTSQGPVPQRPSSSSGVTNEGVWALSSVPVRGAGNTGSKQSQQNRSRSPQTVEKTR